MTFYDNQTGVNPSGNSAPIRSDGVASNNSNQLVNSIYPLTANGIYSSGWIDLQGYKVIYTTLKSDQPSAAGGIKLEFSEDMSTIIHSSSRTYDSANSLFRNPFGVLTRYIRYTYTNGPTAQNMFWFRVYLSNSDIQDSNYDLNQSVTNATLVDSSRAIIETPDDNNLYDKITRTGNALNVNVVNPSSPSSSVSVSNFPTHFSVDNFPSNQGVTILNSAVPVSGTFYQVTQPVSASSLPLPTGAATESTVNAVNNKLPTLGQKASAGSISVVIASDQVVNVAQAKSAANASTGIAVTNTVGNLLAANTNRKGATLYSEGTCFVLLGAGATPTNYTVKLYSGAYYEVPFGYTGLITAITASGTVNVRVGELT